ncbi:MAG: xanthan lyase [Ignavibacteriae bacterium]|nr:MAG: xanthan lyase [Ignavibacteriota bacterium]
MKNILVFIILVLLTTSCSIFDVSEHKEKLSVEDIFIKSFNSKELNYSNFPYSVIDSIKIDSSKKIIDISFNKNFSTVPLRKENVDSIYNETQKFFNSYLPDYSVNIFSMNKNLRELIPNFYRKNNIDKYRLPKKLSTRTPIVFNKSKNLKYKNGLFNKNIALWHSHGWYYNHRLNRWLWQRARLFQTVEDLGPMSFTLPFLVPMLENAGANVFIPRERDTQLNEVIVDNKDDNFSAGRKWKLDETIGFKQFGKSIPANYNPFKYGSYSYIKANKKNIFEAVYQLNIPESGNYFVSVSYQALENSSDSVLYSVYHSGGKTDFIINQKIGGGTWIYLGNFNFKLNNENKVIVSTKLAKENEVITTDAVRLGGGYGVVERNGKTSGRPKFVEAARYYLQFCGIDDTLVYNINGNENDYKDDYQSRGEWVNYLKGSPSGPTKNRNAKGLMLPIDASIAFHSDAGISKSDTTIGTLSIYTINGMDTLDIFPENYSRLANRDFADIIQTEIVNDIRAKYDPIWRRRQLREAQYSESTRPNVPSVLLELASHQNFLDAKFMADPRFRFDVSRSIYKAVLKFLSVQHNFNYIVQPLPIDNFTIHQIGQNKIKLSWEKVSDPLEPTAEADKYIVYTSIDSNGFDNGVIVDSNYLIIDNLDYNKIYNFKITAINKGGESFPSETLSCGFAKNSNPTLLIVNGFDRISTPAHINLDNYSGFINKIDEGVPYQYDISFTGEQFNFHEKSKWKTDDTPGHGASYGDYETNVIAGNTFNYPYLHGKSILGNGYSFVSSSDEAIMNNKVKLNNFKLIDFIFGEEKTTKWIKPYTDSLLGIQYKIYTKEFITKVTDFLNNGGNLFISGSYLGSDIYSLKTTDTTAKNFVLKLLKFKLDSDHAVKNGKIFPTNNFLADTITFNFITEMNDKMYNAEAPDALGAVNGSKTILRYNENHYSAGIAYKDNYGIIAFGFPFETIETNSSRKAVMKSILNFLLGE